MDVIVWGSRRGSCLGTKGPGDGPRPRRRSTSFLRPVTRKRELHGSVRRPYPPRRGHAESDKKRGLGTPVQRHRDTRPGTRSRHHTRRNSGTQGTVKSCPSGKYTHGRPETRVEARTVPDSSLSTLTLFVKDKPSTNHPSFLFSLPLSVQFLEWVQISSLRFHGDIFTPLSRKGGVFLQNRLYVPSFQTTHPYLL